MGFDISSTGNHKTPKGEYFRNNVWWWRPLAQYIIDHTNCVSEEDAEKWGYNDGHEVSENEIDLGDVITIDNLKSILKVQLKKTN